MYAARGANMTERMKALRKLRHVYLYLKAREDAGKDIVMQKYVTVRGPYDFRQTGHVNCKCCDKYKRLFGVSQ
jgi:hypothetical protein